MDNQDENVQMLRAIERNTYEVRAALSRIRNPPGIARIAVGVFLGLVLFVVASTLTWIIAWMIFGVAILAAIKAMGG